MNSKIELTRQGLKTPRAAAFAGIVFSLLLMTGMIIVRTTIPPDPSQDTAAFVAYSERVSFAFGLLPFAGIAFLWFVGVLRDRLGTLEDRFFGTVFFGSALLFLATLFTAGALAGAIVKIMATTPDSALRSGSYALSRANIYQTVNFYVIKMAGVFMVSTSTISLRTRIIPRWMAFLGFASALALLLNFGVFEWVPLVFPLWIFLLSIYILIENLRGVTRDANF
jgi:hypothetical protein